MIALFHSVLALLAGIGVLVVGVGLLGTAVALRSASAGFSDVVTGAILASYFAGFVVGTYVCPRLVDRAGHARTFAAAAAMTAATVLGHAMMVTPLAWGVLRFVTGVCVVALYMVLESWLNEKASDLSRGRVFALYQATSLGGLAVGQYLILVGDLASPTPFMLAAALISIGIVPIALTRTPKPAPIAQVELGLNVLWRQSPLGIASALGSAVANSVLFALGPVYARHLGLDDAGIATFMSGAILGGVLLQWPVGLLSDRWDRRRVILVISIAAATLGGVGQAAAGHSAPAIIAVVFLFGGASFTLYPLGIAFANDRTPPEALLAVSREFSFLVYGVGATLGPLLGGAVMESVGPAGFWHVLAGTSVLLAAFVLYRMLRRSPPPVEAREPFVPLVRTSQAVLDMLPDAVEEARQE